ncbi:MAG: S8 family serine peptidase [Saprospiraceae bacterium]|nr:S8 family serine peptidase [Saprospiraceae bacterium]
MKKLPAEYQLLLMRRAQKQEGDLESFAKAPTMPEEVEIQFEFKDSLEPLITMGLRVVAQDGFFADGVIALSQLEALAAHPNIVRISPSPHWRKALDKSIPDIKANQLWSRSGDVWSGNTGKDVIIGVVDTGIDYVHKSFRKADNSSRILSIWDQTLTPVPPHESSPGTVNTPGGSVTLNYGVEYVREDAGNPNRPTIKKALDNSNPYSVVRHKDTDGHGSHVAGIAGGDGSQSDACCGAYTYIGVAPEAEFIIVRLIGLTDGDPSAPAGSGNSKLNAIRYILDRANGRPCVINLSLGSDLGARDGSGIEEQRVETIVGQYANKMAIIQAASNDGDRKRHVYGYVPDNDTADIFFKIPLDNADTLSLEVRYNGNHLDAALKPPGRTFNAADWQWVTPGNTRTNLDYNGTNGLVLDNGNNETSVIQITLSPPANGKNTSGVWTLRLRNNTSADTDIHAWCEAGIKFNAPTADDATIHISSRSTISPDASGKNVIVVGAYATEGSRKGQLAGFSSRGPALDTTVPDSQNIRPHISAPGVAVTSVATDKYRSDDIWDTICCCDCCQDYYTNMNGTSMATPHVAGAAALMFQKNNDLDWTQILDSLKNTARTDVPDNDDKVPPLPNNNWGWGKLDVKAAVDAVPNPPAPFRAPTPPPAEPVVVRMTADQASLTALRDEFFAIPKARFYQDLVKRHFQEVRALINTNKRVATVWHRNGGPALIRLGMQSAFRPEQPLPIEIEGISLVERAHKIIGIIKRYGSEILIRDIEEHLNDWVWVLSQGFSLKQLLSVFKEQEMIMGTR